MPGPTTAQRPKEQTPTRCCHGRQSRTGGDIKMCCYCALGCTGKHLRQEREDPRCKLHGVPARRVAKAGQTEGEVATGRLPLRGKDPPHLQPKKAPWRPKEAPQAPKRNPSLQSLLPVKKTTLYGGNPTGANYAAASCAAATAANGQTSCSTRRGKDSMWRKTRQKRGISFGSTPPRPRR